MCIDERNIAIQEIHKRIIHSQVNKHLISTDTIVSIILEQPAPRFYITAHRAKKLITQYYNADCSIVPVKRTLRQEMVADLVANYERLRNMYPHTPKEKIFEMVVEQPAKSFYMTYSKVRDVIMNYRPKCRYKRTFRR